MAFTNAQIRLREAAGWEVTLVERGSLEEAMRFLLQMRWRNYSRTICVSGIFAGMVLYYLEVII
jgi:hypothetical protein